ncbi:MAG: hypothetical protein HZB14_04895 [Actinobacteria bacterium]|nr:hypothetical protein [Actinomycetota bacterium]
MTLAELDRSGREIERITDPTTLKRRLAIASVTGRAVAEDSDPGFDFFEFKRTGEFEPAHFPAGQSGSRRLYIKLPSPSPRCKSAYYLLAVTWTWNRGHLIQTRLSGSWSQQNVSPCQTGELDAERITDRAKRRDIPGFVYYNIFVTFSAPIEDLASHETVGAASVGDRHVFASLGLSVRGDGTARYRGQHGSTR